MQKDRLVYLDHAAGTAVDPSVIKAMEPYFGVHFGNPSSLYKEGRLGRQSVESARLGIANILGCEPSEVIFTGSGTESDVLAVLGVARAHKAYGNHILVSSIEHKAVLESAKQLEKEDFDVEYIPVDNYGVVSVDDVIARIKDTTILISVMYANNEIGSIQPIQELGKRIREFKSRKLKVESEENSLREFSSYNLPSTFYPLLHTDACQATGQLPVNVKDLGVDLMTINASKIYGPKGIGALYKKDDITLEPLIIGGGQERGLRGGTENVPFIVGMYEALTLVEERRDAESIRLCSLREYLLESLKRAIPDVVLNGHPTNRLPNNLHISVPQIEGESVVLMLDEMGIQVATGSACSTNDLEVSHVLRASNQDESLMHGSIRITLGKDTTKEDLDYFVSIFSDVVIRLKSMSSLTVQYD
jgi:cysteine desulfurase